MAPREQLTDSPIDWYRFLCRERLVFSGHATVTSLLDHSVLVTGAAGSIGSALSLRLTDIRPRRLVLLDSSEQSLFRLRAALPAAITILGSTTDAPLLDEIFAAHRPSLIFHAGAYKHLSLLEEQPLAALANNALGTRTLARVAHRHDARIVLLSTDKAVAPTSILGASKHIAESIVLASGGTVARLANVLGTSGSVVEIFLQAIDSGHSISITDRSAKRYFLTLEEAVDLLLLSSLVEAPATLLVPNLPRAHSILSLAQFLIATRATGFDVPILDASPRPGEKAREALWSENLGERASPSSLSDCFQISSPRLPGDLLKRLLQQLEQAILQRDLALAIEVVRKLVPGFSPSKTLLTLAERPAHALLGASRT